MSGMQLALQESHSPQDALLERLDAARALLGVTSSSCVDNNASVDVGDQDPECSSENAEAEKIKEASAAKNGIAQIYSVAMTLEEEETQQPKEESIDTNGIPLGGLDALAKLASEESTMNFSFCVVSDPVSSSSSASNSDDDSEAMPPPPPRRRLRSASNPEGMEKWDALSNRQFCRQHFVLPSSILEEELAEASAAMKAKAEEEATLRQDGASLPLKKRARKGIMDALGTSPDSVMSPLALKAGKVNREGDDDEDDVAPEELLRRARSRLLEDLSEGNLNGEKGVLTLPHSLSKYKEVYNKNGRIGIYTPSERAAIISRFNDKRSRRVWNKKIRYNCRKSLADRRMRVKGRFVKRSTEQLVKARIDLPFTTTSTTPSPPPSETSDDVPDEDMPDVNDPEAGFAPTPDQPYRRLRRHTIT